MNRRYDRSLWLATAIAILCGVVALLVLVDMRCLRALEYRRDAIAEGAAWRLVTAHFAHLTAPHAIVDVAGLCLVAWIYSAELDLKEQIAVWVAGIVTIDAALWFLHPEVARYVGLSGVLHAWFAAGAARWLLAAREPGSAMADVATIRRKRAWGAVLLLGLAGKLVLERQGLAFWLDGSPFPVISAAHRWGAAAGCTCGVAIAALRRRAVRVDAATALRAR